MASTTSEITLQHLASVDAQLLFQALEARLASAGVIKKRGVKRVAKTSSSDDASSETSARSVGEGTRAWNTQTSRVAALLKEAAIKGGAGFHLKVLSRLKETGLSAESEPELEQVTEAANWLLAHPEWTSKNQQTKAKKAEESGGEPSGAAAADAPKKVAVVVKKAGAEEKEAKKAAEKAEKAAAAAAEKEAAKAAKAAEKAAAKAAKEAEKPKKAEKKAVAQPAPEPEVEDDEAAVPFAYDGKELFKTKDGRVYNEEGNWYGMYDSKTKKVDTTVPEPAYVN
jgi:flagellar biosynthesis GTPase FlhF